MRSLHCETYNARLAAKPLALQRVARGAGGCLHPHVPAPFPCHPQDRNFRSYSFKLKVAEDNYQGETRCKVRGAAVRVVMCMWEGRSAGNRSAFHAAGCALQWCACTPCLRASHAAAA